MLNKESNNTYTYSWKVVREDGDVDVSLDIVRTYATIPDKLKVHLDNKVVEENNYYNISLIVSGLDKYYKGLLTSESIRIYIGLPPKNGVCLSNPSIGKANLDTFTLSQPGWTDPTGIESYSFSFSIDNGKTYLPLSKTDPTKPTYDLKFPQIY